MQCSLLQPPAIRRVTRRLTLLLALLAVCGSTGRVRAQDEPPGAAAPVLAFVDVNVVPLDADRVIPGQTVLIREGRIDRIGPVDAVEIPEGAERIAGEGRFLMPGLMDLHAHIFSEDELPLYLANGITTVRNMWGWEMHLEMRARIEEGSLPGPALYTAGALIDGDPPRLRGSAVVETAADAERVVSEQARAGYDFIKVYDALTPKAYAAVVLAADKYGLPVVGHVPHGVGLRGVLVAGQRSVEHLSGFPAATSTDSVPTWSSPQDPVLLSEIAEAARRMEVWNAPTLHVLEQGDLSADESEAFLARPELQYLPSFYRRFCCGSGYDPADDLPDGERAERRANRLRAVQALHDAGVDLLLGSDTGNRFVLPGYAIHDELRLLAAAGLTPYEALLAGTRSAARFLGILAHAGTVAEGKRADLILAEQNPLVDLSTLRRPAGVVVRGRWMPAIALRRMLEELAARHAEDAR